ncbi:MAG: ABC transporter permease [Ruminococcus sp.]|nr:ABC transporter permease [Ruminococcus sp.]
MNRIAAFTVRNIKEMVRDPLSYIFCIGFPLVMLIIMTVVNESIPAQSGMTIFRIDNLSAGIAVFGQTFVMLFTALTISKDRSGAFLARMYATPMTPTDFTVGYILPMLIISVIQSVITYAASFIISLITGVSLSAAGILLSVIVLIPSALMFIGFGVLFGTLFNDKAAPGLCSIIISLSSILGCIWFDADSAGGIVLKICRALPFYYSTRSARAAIVPDLSAEKLLIPLMIVVVCAALLLILSAVVFRRKMRADLA